jgi:hypothetical protein
MRDVFAAVDRAVRRALIMDATFVADMTEALRTDTIEMPFDATMQTELRRARADEVHRSSVQLQNDMQR